MNSNSETSTDLNVKNRPQRVIKRPRFADEFYYHIDQTKKEPGEGGSGPKPTDEGQSGSKPVEADQSVVPQSMPAGEDEYVDIESAHDNVIVKIVDEAEADEEIYVMKPMEKPRKKRGRPIKTEKPDGEEKPQDGANMEEKPVKVKRERKKRANNSTTLDDYFPGGEANQQQQRQYHPDPNSVEFELGTTNKNGICVWRDGLQF